ncbi:MAG: hypothetical protein PHH20_04610 [Candidatus Omnitrophica bacterium]|nr:hypothetical protein [Candidatus Omnitrophota bacterium]
MFKKVVLCISTLIFMVSAYDNVFCESLKIRYPVEISGTILDKDGCPFTDNIVIEIFASTTILDFSKPESQMQSSDGKEYKIPAQGGIFSWKGEGSYLRITAIKDGYHSSVVDIFVRPKAPESMTDEEIIAQMIPMEEMTNEMCEEHMLKQIVEYKDITVYVMPQGIPSKLEFVEDAIIPSRKDERSFGKRCGWSFKKMWYYPVDDNEPVDMIRGANENKKLAYTMKDPGGFIYFKGYPISEHKIDDEYPYANFALMPEAPETGYVSTFIPAEHEPSFRGNSYFCYFKTPDGKYGKICFDGYFSYYINPDGSRNLEAGEVKKAGPVRPEYRELIEEQQRGY